MIWDLSVLAVVFVGGVAFWAIFDKPILNFIVQGLGKLEKFFGKQ